jgi:transcriptional regulator with XRE-family HTH domain
MIIGEKLKELRESKQLSQGDIERRAGLRRCYISRVENGHTVPSLDTLEKLARALEIPLYRLFTDEANLEKLDTSISKAESRRGKSADPKVRQFAKALSRMNNKDQELLLHLAWKMANRTLKRAT